MAYGLLRLCESLREHAHILPELGGIRGGAGGLEAIRNGDWRGCHMTPSQDGNPSFERLVSHINWKDQEIVLTVVNFCGDHSNGHIILPEKHCGFLRGKKVKLTDMLSDTVIEKDGGVLLGDHNGLWLNLEPWKAHLFKIVF